MVNVVEAPGHPAAVGTTVITELIGVVPPLTAVNEGKVLLPEVPEPMAGLLLVQLYVVPATVPPKVTAVVAAPLQSVWLGTVFTVGVGFTVMVNVVGVPGHPLAVGVTVMVAVTDVVPVFTALKEAMFPLPEPAKPMDVVVFVQL